MFVNDATRHVAQEYLHGTVLRVSQSITCVIRPIWLTIVYCSRKYPYTPTPHGRQFVLSHPSPPNNTTTCIFLNGNQALTLSHILQWKKSIQL